MSNIDPNTLARELLEAWETRQPVSIPPSARDSGFDVASAYAVEAQIARLRVQKGRTLAGRKVGFANKAMWRILKLESLVWAQMYDDTVHYSEGDRAEISISGRCSPKIEPEIVFKLKGPIPAADLKDPDATLKAVEWLAIGFEIIDCPFPDWQFKPADFVAALGLHAALVIGRPQSIEPTLIPTLVQELARFKLRLLKNDQLVEEGSGANSLRSPALCLTELARIEPLSADELISTGTLTKAHSIAAGDVWRVEVDSLPVAGLTLRLT